MEGEGYDYQYDAGLVGRDGQLRTVYSQQRVLEDEQVIRNELPADRRLK